MQLDLNGTSVWSGKTACDSLLVAVMFDVHLCGFRCVMSGMFVMPARRMRVMRSGRVVTCVMMLSRLMVMTRGFLVVLGRVAMMMSCFF